MERKEKKIFEVFDYILLLCVLILVILGIAFIYSSGVNSEGVLVTNEYIKQIIWASIGQGYLLATPLQLADMVCMVTNSGVVYKPHLLKEVRDPVTSEVLIETKPEILLKSDIDKSVWKEMQETMRYMITDGTAQYPMNNKIVKAAGKTGTAEVAPYKTSWHSWMVCYAPYDAPVEDQVVISTIVEACNPWEWWAPYATNIIIQGIFANQTYDEAIKELGFTYLTKNRGRQE